MRRTFGMNKQQKAVYKQGEQRVGKAQVAELLLLSESEEAEDRLTAAENLCPCHVRTRIPAVWEALYRMMEDSDARVRQAAWHTIEDGGKPSDEAGVARLERICREEKDPKIKRFAEHTLDKVLGKRGEKDTALLWLAARPEIKLRGKCDFCAATDVFVEQDFQTMIPAGHDTRPALACAKCFH